MYINTVLAYVISVGFKFLLKFLSVYVCAHVHVCAPSYVCVERNLRLIKTLFTSIVPLAGFTLTLEFQVTFMFKALRIDTSIVTVTA